MYNRALPVAEADGKLAHIIGIEAKVSSCANVPCAEKVFGRGYYYAGALFAIRHADGSYSVNEVGGRRSPSQVEPALIAPRTYIQSPFQEEPDAVYFGGYDCNDLKNHNRAWVFRGEAQAVLPLYNSSVVFV
eukprot:TRINITY_DN38697_c0_g1_i1.p3 TRINITY_DN38697_c0_g1~~TRINITY_DN38697_c0_g1_i1.p3  ORF type:complete len:132 (-),score=24.18 TRINITY_DN38697_c0_g1_i1:169-564(-)